MCMYVLHMHWYSDCTLCEMCEYDVCVSMLWLHIGPCCYVSGVFDACSSCLQDAATHCASERNTPIAFVGLFLEVLYSNERVANMSFPTRCIQAFDVKKSTTWKVCLCVLVFIFVCARFLWFVSVPFTSHISLSSPSSFALSICMT